MGFCVEEAKAVSRIAALLFRRANSDLLKDLLRGIPQALECWKEREHVRVS